MENHQLILSLRHLVTFAVYQARTQKAKNIASSEPTKQNSYIQAADQSVMEQTMFRLPCFCSIDFEFTLVQRRRNRGRLFHNL